jgi:hypothetical protein
MLTTFDQMLDVMESEVLTTTEFMVADRIERRLRDHGLSPTGVAALALAVGDNYADETGSAQLAAAAAFSAGVEFALVLTERGMATPERQPPAEPPDAA